ncbi:MAG: helix-turn-helix domain-containing protein [Desulfobulbaceae bacterium]
MLPALLTPVEAQLQLAGRFKVLRLAAGYKRSTLAERAGVGEVSLKRFESTGEISLKSLLRLSHALGRLREFDALFHLPEAESLAELKAESAKKKPRRGRV